MIILQNEDRSIGKLSQFIDECGEHRLKGSLLCLVQQGQGGFTNGGIERLAGGDPIPPKADRVVVASIKRNPGNLKRLKVEGGRRKRRNFHPFVKPFADEGCFAEASRSRYQ